MKTFLADLRSMYGMPETENPQRTYEILMEDLSAFPDHLSTDARKALYRIMSGKGNKFPPAHLIMQAAKEAAAQSAPAPDVAATQERINADPYSNQSKATAYRLIRSEVGRQAAQQGWIGHLYSFCCHNRRLPNDREQAQLMQKAHDFGELYAKVCRDQEAEAARPVDRRKGVGSWQPVGGSNANLYATCRRGMEFFLSERDRLSAIANGREAAE